uniref:Uncharacterized protein n=1 Tax=Elaeophora elaphi TaxID=1147741 RepID=A0A0R3S6M8_9BILA
MNFQGGRPCRLPPEYSRMPDFAREKLRSIWYSGMQIMMQMLRENYKSGKSCVAEQIATDVVLTAVNILSSKYRYKVNSKNGRYGYHSITINGPSRTLEDEAVYDEVPVSEIFQLPEFLKDGSKDIINSFTKVWNDTDIPSEGLREEAIHLLAVSLLTTKQLTAYNQYMRERRRCQRQLLFHIRQMSNEARKALNILAYAEPNERLKVSELITQNVSDVCPFTRKANRFI